MTVNKLFSKRQEAKRIQFYHFVEKVKKQYKS